jgi:hypothetical protein
MKAWATSGLPLLRVKWDRIGCDLKSIVVADILLGQTIGG